MGRTTWFIPGLFMLAGFALVAVSGRPARSQSGGGPVILMGIDAEDGGPGVHGPMSAFNQVVASLLGNVTNGGSGVLVIGGGKRPNDDVTEWWNGITVTTKTFVNGADNIRNQSFAGFAAIAVASDRFNTPFGGLTQEENDALAQRQQEIASFVNNGGGLLGFTSDFQPGTEYAYLAGLGQFSVTTGLGYVQIFPTPEGAAVGITPQITGPWHDVYNSFPSYLRVLATNNFNQNAAIGGRSVLVTSVRPPTNLTATPVTLQAIRLNWQDNSDNEIGFEVERKLGPANSTNPFVRLVTVPANTTTYLNTGVTPFTTYTYRVRATRGGTDVSPYSNLATATTVGPPEAPTNLVATVLSQAQVGLTWQDNSIGEDGFRIERKPGLPGSPGTYTEIRVTARDVTSYVDTGISANTAYTYRVRAFNSVGYSAYSNLAAAGPPAAPSNLTGVAVSRSSVRISWRDNSTNEDGFKIERRVGAGTWSQIAQVVSDFTFFADSGLRADTTYRYRVRAYNRFGPSDYTNELAISPGPPAAPTNLTLTPTSARQVRLTWRDNSNNEAGFELERRIGSGSFTRLRVVAPNTTSFTQGGLIVGQTYAFRVRAYNPAGRSAYSNEVSHTP